VNHLFRFLFTAAILLVSLMIFNGQKGEDITRQGEHADIEHIELQAEICFMRIASASGQSNWRSTGASILPVSSNTNDSEYQLRLKNQMQIHREFLPELDYQSGHYLQHYTSFEDPLIA
jgi:hypothetical protein